MAQQRIQVLVDDFDGTEATGTFEFKRGGRTFKLDVNDKNRTMVEAALAKATKIETDAAAKVEAVLAPIMEKARGRKVSKSATSSDAAQVREWAMGQGLITAKRGRLPAEVRAAYAATHTKG